MVFKRRDRRSPARIASDFVYPRGGWTRAFLYVKHRVRRLPDTPRRIARGVWAGVFTSFTPLFGMHFFVAALVAWVMRGNIIAALMATFFGNPLTFVPIAAVSMRLGHYLLGTEFEHADASIGRKFESAAGDLWHNFKAAFNKDVADWHGLAVFYNEVFFPYLIGGLIPGVIAATIMYWLSVPLIAAYQNRRREKIRAKFEAIKRLAEADTAVSGNFPVGSPRQGHKEARDA
ncbi:DUF2062 domain-containing protein [Lutimaribacter marinistellae]|uniref:DUF2062 domain-containing protein n=1 Tax=Lutimaribacter marinistellae TaxID=1820329 RepID=A0ABV7TE60_9RHOB